MSVVSLFPEMTPAALGLPNEALIQALEDALEMAREGRLQSLWATGFTSDKCRFALSIEGGSRNVYEVLGAIQWLGHEYVGRVATVAQAEAL